MCLIVVLKEFGTNGKRANDKTVERASELRGMLMLITHALRRMERDA